jgi:hypothetical protein
VEKVSFEIPMPRRHVRGYLRGAASPEFLAALMRCLAVAECEALLAAPV